MSTTYYICRKQEYERSEAISSYTERIRQTLFSYLNASFSPKLKNDAQLMDDLEEAIYPMCRELEYRSAIARKYGYARLHEIELSGIEKKQLKLDSRKQMNLW